MKTYKHRLIYVVQPITLPVLSSLYEIVVESDSEIITKELIECNKKKVKTKAAQLLNVNDEDVAVSFLSPISFFIEA